MNGPLEEYERELEEEIRKTFPPPRLGPVMFVLRERLDPIRCWDCNVMVRGGRVYTVTDHTETLAFEGARDWATKQAFWETPR